MPKLLRILVPLVVLGAVLAIPTTASAQTATTCGSGGWASDVPGSTYFMDCPAPRENYEWKSSVIRSNTATQSDFAFTGKYVAAGNYAGFRIFDISDPANPVLMSDTPCGGSQGDINIVGDLLIRSSDGSHNVPFADLNRACETSGNENQRVTLESFDTDGDSFRLRFQGADTVPITRGQNNTTAGIDAALEGGNEQQAVSLTSFDTNGDSYTLELLGNTSIPIVRGTNNNTAGIQQAILGVDELQTLSLANFNGAVDSFVINYGGNSSTALGQGGAAVNAANIQSALNGIAGFPGGATVTGSGNGPYTITFAGASAKTNVDQLTVTFDAGADPADDCNLAVPACAATIATTREGRAPLHPSVAGATVTVGSLSDNGYTLTFSGTHVQTDIGAFSITNGTGDVTGTVRENIKGTPPVAGWLAGGTSTISSLSDAGFNVTFAGNYAAADLPNMSVVAGTGDVTGTVAEQAKGAPGAGFVGMYVFDISDVSNPKFLKAVPVCGGGHTNTVYDDKKNNRVVVYMTRSGTTGSVPGFGVSCAGLPSNRLTAVTIPKNNPKAARIASENIVYPGSGGCHDTNVFEEKKRILVACLGSGVSMLDISDPLNATVVWGPFTWPSHGTWHTGSWSWSGDYVYVNGEPGGGGASECAFDDHPAKPTVFALNADTGELKGTWTLPRPQETTSSQSNCTVHNLNVLPLANKNVLAHSYYTAGASIIDFTNPKAPKEVAFVDQVVTPGGGGVITSGAGCWSAYWYNGTIFCNELNWGLHLFDVDLPFWDDAMTLPAHNPQTVTNFIRCQVSFTGGPTRAGQNGTVTATAQLYGPADLQPAKDTRIRISGPGFSKLVTTNDEGVAQATVRAMRRGQLNVAVREADNLNITGGCAAPSKPLARKAVKRAAVKATRR